MAPLPLGRIIAQVIVPLVAVLARAIPAAYSQAINNARRNGVDASKAATEILTKKLDKSEALLILNIAEKEATAEVVEKVRVVVDFDHFLLDCRRTLPNAFFPLHSNLKNTLQRTQWTMEDHSTCKVKFTVRKKCWTNT